jgi:hypothetical protein
MITIKEEDAVIKEEYAFEWNLKPLDIMENSIDSPTFSISGSKFYLQLERNDKDSNYDCFLFPEDATSVLFPGSLHCQFDLVSRRKKIVKTSEHRHVFYKSEDGGGATAWIASRTIRKYVLKVKLWATQSFNDFVTKPVPFNDIGFQLFDEMYSNLSFKVDGKVVYVIHKVLSSKSAYFRVLLENVFSAAKVPITVDSEIIISGIEVDVFKMIIEWIYTMDIKKLGGMSATLLFDLERLYVAADLYQITDLCESIEAYLESLVNEQTFGEIHGIANRLGNESLRSLIYSSWIVMSDGFNENDAQIETIIEEEAGAVYYEEVEEIVAFDQNHDITVKKERDTRIVEGNTAGYAPDKEAVENAAIIELSRKIIQASSWDGETDSKACVIKCLTSLLSVKEESMKKRKIKSEFQ